MLPDGPYARRGEEQADVSGWEQGAPAGVHGGVLPPRRPGLHSTCAARPAPARPSALKPRWP